MSNKLDPRRNEFMLTGPFAKEGYDWWWHSFTAVNSETGEEKPFFIEFFVCNPALGGDKPILGQLPENKANGIKPSYLMVKAGCWGEDHLQLHRFFAWDDVKLHPAAPFSVGADDCYCSDNVLKGSIAITKSDSDAHPEWMCDFGEISWSLLADKKIAYNVGYGASTPLRTAKAFEMYWHAEGMKTEYTGEVVLNGVKYDVKPESCYGYADKNWGKGFTSPWVWLSSNDLVSNITGEPYEQRIRHWRRQT
ncbi:MAG: hypothetical protein KBS66_05300 [Eubacterium sp.]|nr:hypothetical protein [Candidatus Colimonas fimequi]